MQLLIRRQLRTLIRPRLLSLIQRRSLSRIRHRFRSPFQIQSRSPFQPRFCSLVQHRIRSPCQRQFRSPIRRHFLFLTRFHFRNRIRRRFLSPLRRQFRHPPRRIARRINYRTFHRFHHDINLARLRPCRHHRTSTHPVDWRSAIRRLSLVPLTVFRRLRRFHTGRLRPAQLHSNPAPQSVTQPPRFRCQAVVDNGLLHSLGTYQHLRLFRADQHFIINLLLHQQAIQCHSTRCIIVHRRYTHQTTGFTHLAHHTLRRVVQASSHPV